MTPDRYICCDDNRRALLASDPGDVSGIDYIEITQGATIADATTIDIFLIKPLALPAAALTADNIVVSGGVRFATPPVGAVAALPGPNTASQYRLTIPGNHPTDFSTYRLAIVAGPGSTAPPAFIDTRLSAVEFSFKVDCPTDFDCVPDGKLPPEPLPLDPPFDYRARDYQGFRRLMLDRIAALVPGYREDDPLDFTTTLVEALAYRADQLSYKLDWVGTEAFLSTARSRTSVLRHARLVDYTPGEGASALVFAQIAPDPDADGIVLRKGTPLLVQTEGLSPVVSGADYTRLLGQPPTVFETVAPLTVWSWRNRIAIHTWSDDQCVLPKGATAVTLVDASGPPSGLSVGDFLLLAETASPRTGDPDDARKDRRHVVRLTRVEAPVKDVLAPTLRLVTVEWSVADALPFDLVIASRSDDALGNTATHICATASGNIMLADHGASLPPPGHLALAPAESEAVRPKLEPSTPGAEGRWRPLLDRIDVARVAPVDLAERPVVPATALAHPRPAELLPALQLDDDFAVWSSRRDLLHSTRFERSFVVETGIAGKVGLRFGDNLNGLAPGLGSTFAASGRFGSGLAGNIAIGALAHAVVEPALEGRHFKVTNPLPARGGAAPEPLGAIRIAAPQAFRRQERAVTAADYADAAMSHPEVINAVAVPRWTGAWQTMLIYIDRQGGRPVDRSFRTDVLTHLEHYRLMGFDVALRGALAAPLEIDMFVCARPGEIRATVATRVRDALRPYGPPDGTAGFFHPDNFTFGAPLYLSRLIAAVMAVPGVQSVTVRKFQRLGLVARGELADGVIRPNGFEVLQLDDDPSFPERGRLTLEMGGGR